jgi:uncharacterized protein (DUF736 family)
MQYFYDGQVRRYLLQIIRLLSNFVVKYGDGSLVRVPVMYGDADRQAANIIKQNSENTILAAPRIAVYITELELDMSRISDSSFISKVHVRERAVNELTGEYTSSQGNNYTVERLMPTPFKLTVKADIWSSSNDQKLQILEQILMLFNPSLEIQTTDNYVDWTSLSVVDLTQVVYSGRSIPVGTATEIDIATLTLQTPIWISPPAKIKRLGVTTSVITNILSSLNNSNGDYVEGLGSDNNISGLTNPPTDPLFGQTTTIGNFDIEVVNGQIKLISNEGTYLAWSMLIQQHPNVYHPSLTKIYLRQPDGSYVVGYIAISSLDDTIMVVDWDSDTYPGNTLISSSYRTSTGTFDAIIDPQQTGPVNLVVGTRYLILENIGGGLRDTFEAVNSVKRINTNTLHRKVNDHKVWVNGVEVGSGSARIPDNIDTGNYYIVLDAMAPSGSEIVYELIMNEDGPDAWKNTDGSDTVAAANDIIEWTGTDWVVVFSAQENINNLVYLTNIYPGKPDVQYKWNGVGWSKSFEGVYRKEDWRLEL